MNMLALIGREHMTCIVGLVDGIDVWMGGDSAESDDKWNLNLCYDKVFIKDGFIYGYSGYSRFCQLVEFAFQRPSLTDPLDAYMCTTWINELRNCLREGGSLKIENNVEVMGGTLLVGVRGRLFYIDNDLSCVEYREDFMATGCGGRVALGAMFATKDLCPPNERILIALEAAQQFNIGVRSPFVVKVLKG